MAGSPKLRIKKYFGSASIQEMIFDLDEAKSFLAYFWTKDGGSNVMIAVNGQQANSYEELVKLATQEYDKNHAYVDVGLYLTPKR